jgi:pimeloyl-ACP methyl ester carboxylesterase
MANARPRGILGVGWACLEATLHGRVEHRPTSADYPDTLVKRIAFTAGGGLGWRISAITTPRERPAPWKFVVITGAPSWAEYWAPVLAALPMDREMVVVDRPGFAGSEPGHCVPDIRQQARALMPLLEGPRDQTLILVGQSYGGAIATLMADAQPGRVASLVLLSSYLGEPGPTARRLLQLGARLGGVIPRDLQNAVKEINGQPAQLGEVRAALKRLRMPVHVLHGDADDFAPIDVARALTQGPGWRRPVRFQAIAGGNHFLNDGPVEPLLACIESCVPPARARPGAFARLGSWLGLDRRFAGLSGAFAADSKKGAGQTPAAQGV